MYFIFFVAVLDIAVYFAFIAAALGVRVYNLWQFTLKYVRLLYA